jgi:hypothetical protein
MKPTEIVLKGGEEDERQWWRGEYNKGTLQAHMEMSQWNSTVYLIYANKSSLKNWKKKETPLFNWTHMGFFVSIVYLVCVFSLLHFLFFNNVFYLLQKWDLNSVVHTC